MEFKFNVQNKLGCDHHGIAIIDASSVNDIKHSCFFLIREIIDTLGFLSAKASNSKNIVTTSEKFFSTNNRLYIKCQGNSVIGFLKVGLKTLFLRKDEEEFYDEYSVFCILDFYINEKHQRRRYGKELFDRMLEMEKTFPEKLAYDNPTKQIKNFLYKHYQLSKTIAQTNNFTIYQEFFENRNFTRVNENMNKYSNYNNLDVDSSGKIANLGRDLVYNNNYDKNLDNEKGSNNVNHNRQFPSTINRINKSEIFNDLSKYNQQTSSNNLINNNSSISKSTNFMERKNFAFYYLNDLSKSPSLSPARGVNPVNINYKSLSPMINSSSAHENHFNYIYSYNKNEIEKTKERIRNLENKLSPQKLEFYEYNKRNEFATFSDKNVNKINMLSYLKNSEGLYNRNIEINPIQPLYK